jgi:hypothetical protein
VSPLARALARAQHHTDRVVVGDCDWTGSGSQLPAEKIVETPERLQRIQQLLSVQVVRPDELLRGSGGATHVNAAGPVHAASPSGAAIHVPVSFSQSWESSSPRLVGQTCGAGVEGPGVWLWGKTHCTGALTQLWQAGQRKKAHTVLKTTGRHALSTALSTRRFCPTHLMYAGTPSMTIMPGAKPMPHQGGLRERPRLPGNGRQTKGPSHGPH